MLWQPDGQLSTLGSGVATSINDLDGRGRHESIERASGRLARRVPDDHHGRLRRGDGHHTAGAGGWMMVAGERHGFVWHADHGLQDLGPGEARNIDEIGDIAGCRESGDESRATVGQVGMTDAGLRRRFRIIGTAPAGRRRGQVVTRVFREIDLAQKLSITSTARSRSITSTVPCGRSPTWRDLESWRRIGRRRCGIGHWIAERM